MSPPDTVLHAALLSGVHTDLLISRYSDKLLISLTQLGKLGTVLLVEKEAVKTGDARTEDGRQVFSSQVLLGQDSEELQLLARVLAEKLRLSKPLVLTVGVKCLSVPLITDLVKFVTQHLTSD